jgi:hypothetical protein
MITFGSERTKSANSGTERYVSPGIDPGYIRLPQLEK